MSKIKLLAVSLLTLLLLPIGVMYAQEEDYMVDDPVLYEEAPDYEYDWESSYEDAQDLIYTTQDSMVEDTAAGLLGAGILSIFAGIYAFVVSAFALATYIFSALALSKIGKEMNYENSWFAWVPILNTIMTFQLGGQNPMLLLLLLIPGLGALIVSILTIIALADITEKRGYDKLLVLLVLIPLGMFVLLYLLAWKPKTAVQPTA
jgi:hypothetical protein